MLRALFFREYRKSAVVHAAILGTLLGLLMAFERLAPRFGMSDAADPIFLNPLLITGLAASGLMAGERCFSASFKEGRYYFLIALPLQRALLWAVLCLPRLLGAWTAILSFLGLWFVLAGGVPPEMTMGRWSLLSTVASFLVAHATSFLTGAALALALRKEILVYVFGLPLLAFLGATAGANLTYGFDLGFPDSLALILIRVAALGVLLAFSMAVIGTWLFVRGEFDRWPQSVVAFALIALLAVGHLASTHLLTLNRSMTRWGDVWIRPGRFDWFRISPDGELVVVLQRLRHRGVLSRFEVLETRSGSTVGSREIFFLTNLEWSGTGKTLNAMVIDSGAIFRCIWLPCSEGPRWFRFTPAAKKVAQMDLGSVVGIYGHPETTDRFLIGRDGEQAIAYRVGDQGLPQEVWRGPALAPIQVEHRMSGLVLTTMIGKETIKEWSLGPDGSVNDPSDLDRVEDLKRQREEALILAGKTLPFEQERSIEVGPRYPADYGSFFLERNGAGLLNLWHFDGRGSWKPVLPNLPTSGESRVPPFDPLRSVREARRPAIHWPTGTVAFVETRLGHDSLDLFSARLGRRLSTSVRCLPSEEGAVNFERLHNGRALVRFACGRGGIWRRRFFLFRSESNQLREIANLPRDLPLDVAWHHLADDGFLIWSVAGKEIWSLTPGRTPLRIWPPA